MWCPHGLILVPTPEPVFASNPSTLGTCVLMPSIHRTRWAAQHTAWATETTFRPETGSLAPGACGLRCSVGCEAITCVLGLIALRDPPMQPDLWVYCFTYEQFWLECRRSMNVAKSVDEFKICHVWLDFGSNPTPQYWQRNWVTLAMSGFDPIILFYKLRTSIEAYLFGSSATIWLLQMPHDWKRTYWYQNRYESEMIVG